MVSRKRRKSAWSTASATAFTGIEASATTSSSIQMLLPVRTARAMASLGLASNSIGSELDALLSLSTARKVASSMEWMITRSSCSPAALSMAAIRSWLRGRGSCCGLRPARMFWAWA
jgi:hypothetical protein